VVPGADDDLGPAHRRRRARARDRRELDADVLDAPEAASRLGELLMQRARLGGGCVVDRGTPATSAAILASRSTPAQPPPGVTR
jgi:hypothetical protein